MLIVPKKREDMEEFFVGLVDAFQKDIPEYAWSLQPRDGLAIAHDTAVIFLDRKRGGGRGALTIDVLSERKRRRTDAVLVDNASVEHGGVTVSAADVAVVSGSPAYQSAFTLPLGELERVRDRAEIAIEEFSRKLWAAQRVLSRRAFANRIGAQLRDVGFTTCETDDHRHEIQVGATAVTVHAPPSEAASDLRVGEDGECILTVYGVKTVAAVGAILVALSGVQEDE